MQRLFLLIIILLLLSKDYLGDDDDAIVMQNAQDDDDQVEIYSAFSTLSCSLCVEKKVCKSIHVIILLRYVTMLRLRVVYLIFI